MKKYVLSFAAVLVLVAGGALVYAQTAGGQGKMMHRWGHGRGMMLGHLAQQLNLTEAQQAQIKQIMQAEKPAMEPLRQQLAQDQKQLLLAVTSNGPLDEAKVQSLASQAAQTQAQITVERAKMASKVYNLLTPEQKTKADQLRDQWLSRMEKSATPGAGPGK